MRTIVQRRFVAQFLDRQVGHDVAAMLYHEALARRGVADHGEIQSPLFEDCLGLLFLFGLEHHEHALLAFRQHHLIGAHAGLAGRHRIEIEIDAEIALGAHLDRRAGQARRAHVLDRDHAVGFHDFEAGFQQQFFRKGIADLHGRTFLGGSRRRIRPTPSRRRECRHGRSWSRDRRSACSRRRRLRKRSCRYRRARPPSR